LECGFRRNRLITDPRFSIRQILEEKIEIQAVPAAAVVVVVVAAAVVVVVVAIIIIIC
jgi:hypothetical protein